MPPVDTQSAGTASQEEGTGLSQLALIYGQVVQVKARLEFLQETVAPLARMEQLATRVDGIESDLKSAMRAREQERREHVEIINNRTDNRTKRWEAVMRVVQAVIVGALAALGTWAAQGFPGL